MYWNVDWAELVEFYRVFLYLHAQFCLCLCASIFAFNICRLVCNASFICIYRSKKNRNVSLFFVWNARINFKWWCVCVLNFFLFVCLSRNGVCACFFVVVDRGTLHIRSQFQRFHHMFATKRPRIKTLMFQSLCWFFLSLSHFSVSLQSHRIFVFKFNRIFAWLLLYGQVSMDSIFLILIKNIAIVRWIL